MIVVDQVHGLVAKYDAIMARRDMRLEHKFLMSSPLYTAGITLAYLAFVRYGPRMMADRKPFELKSIIKFYNLFLSIFSGYLFYEGLMSGWWNDYSFSCQLVDYSNNPKALRMVTTLHLGFMTKLIELLDTVFFILRKKNKQVSFLHVFHHACIPINAYFALKFVAGGLGTFGCMLNTAVHCVMYFYYFLSAFGQRFQPYLWWKKYLTRMQIIQFLLMIAHGAQFAFIPCAYPIEWGYWAAGYVILILGLFINFYIKEYNMKNKKAKELKEAKKVE